MTSESPCSSDSLRSWITLSVTSCKTFFLQFNKKYLYLEPFITILFSYFKSNVFLTLQQIRHYHPNWTHEYILNGRQFFQILGNLLGWFLVRLPVFFT